MNFEKCFDILNSRQGQHEHSTADNKDSQAAAAAACPCLTALTTEHVSPSTLHTDTGDKEDTTEEESVVYEDLGALELLEKFFRLQEERVMVRGARACMHDRIYNII
jgi:hypothetical protein